ncbi:MAG: FtsW/RodA/SpoVE family cell cycle protein [Clostridia bacterium]|nr:FtsW/RodA/SpoVE family cell cycle protein [Clostridia bacterium]
MTGSVGAYKNKQTTLKKKSPLLKSEALNMPMFDIPFLISVFLILAVGLVMLYSTGYAASFFKNDGNSYYYISKQIKFAIVGIGAMFLVSVLPSLIPKKLYNLLIMLFYLASMALLVIVLIVSKETEKRWLYIGGFQFQPSEFAKLAIIMMLALYISVYKEDMNKFLKGIVFPGILFGVAVILVFLEPHLSGAILIAGIGYVMLLTGGCNKWIALIGLGLVIVVFLLLDYSISQDNYLFLKEYQAKRFIVWHDPSEDLLGSGFQPYQSLLTIGSGGAFGLGYGKSRQKYLFLPEPQNDFIFSVIAEELGFVGVIVIMLLFIFLIWRGFYIGIRARNTFESMLVIGIISKVAIQTLLNFAVVSNSIPSTGISLPFFSYGGTALLVQLAEMGLVLHASRFAYLDKGKKDKKE